MRLAYFLFAALLVSPLLAQDTTSFASAWPSHVERTWPGEDYYANRFADWRISGGRLECIGRWQGKPMRTVHLLSHTMGATQGTLDMSVTTGLLKPGTKKNANAWSGFLIGVGGAHVDFRTSALCHHWPAADGGLICAVDGNGNAIFRLNNVLAGRRPQSLGAWPEHDDVERRGEGFGATGPRPTRLRLRLDTKDGKNTLTLTVTDESNGKLISWAQIHAVAEQLLDGNVALVSHRFVKKQSLGYWFTDWRASGSRLQYRPRQRFGPILAAQHTLNGDNLRMTVQLPPLGIDDVRSVRLLVEADNEFGFQHRATSRWRDLSFTATFDVAGWDTTRDQKYRIEYDLITAPSKVTTHHFDGTIRAAPHSKEEFVLAAFTGHHISARGAGNWNSGSIWYPHNELVSAVEKHKPDMLFFSGDQVYEGGLAGIIRNPLRDAVLDYHYHWFQWCWAFRDLARDIPCVCLPDDHDVYHGNVWGAGGKKAVRLKGVGQNAQDSGGYTMNPAFVNAVHETQVSHLPEGSDNGPITQGITTYHTQMDYAGLSFGIIADRMFKSSPSVMVPEGDCRNGWFRKPGFDAAKSADTPGCKLLGSRQLEFLTEWGNNWGRETWMKVLLSQTIFANIATLPAEANNDGVVPGLKYPGPGEYIEGDRLAADADSNGWPRTPRDQALRIIRRCFPFHIAGDQHLGSFSRYGVDEWGDAPYALCVPSIANLWPRRWFPPTPGRNRLPGTPRNTGDFHDGFGNKITVMAVANPMRSGIKPTALNDRMPGYGIVRFKRSNRTIRSEVWPRWVDPDSPTASQYPGWPITVKQEDAYARRPVGWLPVIEIKGMRDPVVQVINEKTQTVEYTLRIKGQMFRARVFDIAPHTVIVGEPADNNTQARKGILPSKHGPDGKLQFTF